MVYDAWQDTFDIEYHNPLKITLLSRSLTT